MTAAPRLRLVQFNPLVGDVAGNRQRIEARLAAAPEPAIWVYPELALCGYPPEDLLLRADFLDRTEAALERLAAACGEHWLIVGAPLRADGALYNAACVLHAGTRAACARKRRLPHYDVFDEPRYFAPGEGGAVAAVAGRRLGLLICADLWRPEPAAELARAGAELLVCLNASPFDAGKAARRREIAAARAAETGLPVCYVNQVGGQDELVFDGASFVLGADGARLRQAPSFEEAELALDPADPGAAPPAGIADPEPDEALYRALVTGVRDYVDKHGAPGGLVGLSGGVDSALTLAVAVDALGADRVEAVLMPSRYTADASNEDAAELCANLGVAFRSVSIEPAFEALLASLAAAGIGGDLVEQNLQARIRGLLLMAFSNRGGKLLLTTGNKSELAVGYATLYGDMAGGYAPLKDVFKTRVYELARWRNRRAPVIPERILTRPPSAELKPGQRDDDTLPDYAELDAVLRGFIEDDLAAAELAARGHDGALVRDVVRRVFGSEHKRRQAPPGVKTTRRAFGRDRRYPITSGYRG